MQFTIFFPHWKDNAKVHYSLWCSLGIFWSSLDVLIRFSFLSRKEKELIVIWCCNNISVKGKKKNTSKFCDLSYILESNTHSSSQLMIKSNIHCNTGNMVVALLSLIFMEENSDHRGSWPNPTKNEEVAPILFAGFSTFPVTSM